MNGPVGLALLAPGLLGGFEDRVLRTVPWTSVLRCVSLSFRGRIVVLGLADGSWEALRISSFVPYRGPLSSGS